MGTRPKKRFSQNFLIDSNIAEKLVSFLEVDKDDTIVEIGAGRGTLTAFLGETGARILAYEIDRDLIDDLTTKFKDRGNIIIINQDFLRAEPSQFQADRFKLLGNIPYDITSPVLAWMTKNRSMISRAVITTQRELAERISSSHGSKNWAPISIFCQCVFAIRKILTISPVSFFPPPNVVSAALLFEPRKSFDIGNWERFESVVRASFLHRRKLLVNNLSELEDITRGQVEDAIRKVGLDRNVRAEEVSIEEFIQISELLTDLNKS